MVRQTNLAANEYLHAQTMEPESTAAPVANRDPAVEENSEELTKRVHIGGPRCPVGHGRIQSRFCRICGECHTPASLVERPGRIKPQ